MEDRILRLHPVIKELVADMEKQKKDMEYHQRERDTLQRNIYDIRDGIHGLKEINATLRKLVRKVEDSDG
jgi:cell division protein FtsB